MNDCDNQVAIVKGGVDLIKYSFYKLLTGENQLALADGMKPDGLTVTATPKWWSTL